VQDLTASYGHALRPLHFASKKFCSSPSICISPESSELGSKLSSPARLQSSMLNSAGIISSSHNGSLFPYNGEMARSSAGMSLPTLATSPTAVPDVFYSIADILFGSIIKTINKHLHSINNSIHKYVVMTIAARVRAGRAAIKEGLLDIFRSPVTNPHLGQSCQWHHLTPKRCGLLLSKYPKLAE
jgi:hypothetical protein